MKSLHDRLARIEAAEEPVEFWLNLGDGHVASGRTGERLSLDALRERFGARVFPFTFEVENAGSRQ